MTFDLAQMIAALQDRTMSWVGDGSQPDPLCTQAAAEITRLTARVAELEGAISYIADGFGLNAPAFATPIFEEEDDDSLEDSEWIFEVIRTALSTHTEEPKT